MSKQIRITLTLSDSNYGDREIIDFIERFGSGKGNQERSFEIKRLLKFAIEQERFVRNFGGSSFASRTIRPTLVSEDVFQERQALILEKPMPKLAIPVVAADEGADSHPHQQEPQAGLEGEVVPPKKAVSVPPPEKVVNRALEMYGHLMDSLPAEEQKPI